MQALATYESRPSGVMIFFPLSFWKYSWTGCGAWLRRHSLLLCRAFPISEAHTEYKAYLSLIGIRKAESASSEEIFYSIAC
jgi:hypothetical protein